MSYQFIILLYFFLDFKPGAFDFLVRHLLPVIIYGKSLDGQLVFGFHVPRDGDFYDLRTDERRVKHNPVQLVFLLKHRENRPLALFTDFLVGHFPLGGEERVIDGSRIVSGIVEVVYLDTVSYCNHI